METLAVDWLGYGEKLLYILYVAIGLGFVIFFHELGHFAVAKWCGVMVERFSIGFGPILLSFKRGETEYALSAIPFGGYVKMLGQDDMDPSQLSSEEIAEDPRSYSAKAVWQRMLIISAGVVMNVITGILFFAAAFVGGVENMPPIVGYVSPGMPAWEAGLRQGDRITWVDGNKINSFEDIMMAVPLSWGKNIVVEGAHQDGKKFKFTITPQRKSKTRRQIGLGPSSSLQLPPPRANGLPPTIEGTSAAAAKPAFAPLDRIVKINGIEVDSFAEMQQVLAEKRNEEVEILVKRTLPGKEPETSTEVEKLIKVAPNQFRTLGLIMDVGEIASIRNDSPAFGKLKKGDKILQVAGKKIGESIEHWDLGLFDSLKLPDVFSKLHGQEVLVVVLRDDESGGKEEVEVTLVPDDVPPWTEVPIGENSPLPISSIGVATHLTSKVIKVEPDSPAFNAGIKAGAIVKAIHLNLPEEEGRDDYEKRSIETKFGDDQKNWAWFFWRMQTMPRRTANVVFSMDKTKPDSKPLKLELAKNWPSPARGIHLMRQTEIRKAENLGQALSMGANYGYKTLLQIYLTLRNLFGGRLPVEELHGPIGIAKVAYEIAQMGWPRLMMFLGFLSINLAVLNFLPIPVLDGGHMVFLVWEAVTRKRPSERVMVAATYCGFAFVIGLMVFVFYLDIFVHKLN